MSKLAFRRTCKAWGSVAGHAIGFGTHHDQVHRHYSPTLRHKLRGQMRLTITRAKVDLGRVKDGLEPVIAELGNGIVLVIVATRAGEGEAEESVFREVLAGVR